MVTKSSEQLSPRSQLVRARLWGALRCGTPGTVLPHSASQPHRQPMGTAGSAGELGGGSVSAALALCSGRCPPGRLCCSADGEWPPLKEGPS